MIVCQLAINSVIYNSYSSTTLKINIFLIWNWSDSVVFLFFIPFLLLYLSISFTIYMKLIISWTLNIFTFCIINAKSNCICYRRHVIIVVYEWKSKSSSIIVLCYIDWYLFHIDRNKCIDWILGFKASMFAYWVLLYILANKIVSFIYRNHPHYLCVSNKNSIVWYNKTFIDRVLRQHLFVWNSDWTVALGLWFHVTNWWICASNKTVGVLEPSQ